MLRVARAYAATDDRDYVTPDDIKTLVVSRGSGELDDFGHAQLAKAGVAQGGTAARER